MQSRRTKKLDKLKHQDDGPIARLLTRMSQMISLNNETVKLSDCES